MIEYKTIHASPSLISTIKEEKILVVFIHGLGGKGTTWDDFIRVMDECSDLSGLFAYNIYEYPTKLFKLFRKLPSLEVISDGLHTFLEYQAKNYKSIVFVCHSMGGLICKRYLSRYMSNNYRNTQFSFRAALFYATPHNGSVLANIFIFFSPLFRQMSFLRIRSKGIKELNTQWKELGISEKIRAKYIIGGKDIIVSPKSAQFFENNQDVAALPYAGHFKIHRPKSQTETSFLIFKEEMLKVFNTIIENSENDEEQENGQSQDDE